ncbi:MAG: hypothetical protein FD166_254 [Bacteroidetes bacterium]|nr:MAG: hypothetical protein FD166_254 [Bacteroidota bacterium]
MKKILTFLSVFLFLTLSGIAQKKFPVLDKLVIPKQNMQLQADIQVFNEVKDTTSRKATLEYFQLKPDERKAVVRTGDIISRIDSPAVHPGQVVPDRSEVFMLPELYYARVAGTDEQISYRILFIDAGPLRYNFESALFEGNVRFLPVEVTDSGKIKPVKKTLSVPEEIIVSFDPESIPLSISEVNWPPREVSIKARDPRDSLEVRIITMSNPAGYYKSLRIEPAILISSVRTTIQGMGIQTLPLHITLKGVSKYTPVHVGIESSLGTLDSANLVLTGDKPGKIILRSESLGTIEVKVVNASYRSNSITIEAVFPWLFLLLAIFGGLIGGLGKNLLGRKKIAVRSIALGSIFGLIAAFAYWGLGIVLIGFSIETRGLNEAMVFGLGLIAGYFGLMTVKTPTTS